MSVIPVETGIHLLCESTAPCRAGNKPPRYTEESKTDVRHSRESGNPSSLRKYRTMPSGGQAPAQHGGKQDK